MNNKDDFAFIEHILDSTNAIEEFSKNLNKKELFSNRLKQSAIIREIEIIGEAAKNISEETKRKYPEIEWKEIAGTRDIIIHAYFNVNIDITWDIIRINLPDLKDKIIKIKRELEEKEE